MTVKSKSSFELVAIFFNSIIFFENGFDVFKIFSKASTAADSSCKKIELSIAVLLRSIQADVNSFHSIIDLNKTAIDNSIFLHEESAAVLALENILKTSKPFSKNIIELKNIATNSKDDLLLTVIDSIPITLQSKGKYSYFLFLIIIIMIYVVFII